MSLEGSQVAYLEYFSTPQTTTPRLDLAASPNTYYIAVKEETGLTTNLLHVANSSSIENTPEQEEYTVNSRLVDQSPSSSSSHRRLIIDTNAAAATTPVRKVFPARTYLEDSLSLASSSYNLTPDKEAEYYSPNRYRWVIALKRFFLIFKI